MICNYFIFVSININDPIFFSLFAGMTILCNFILMLTWTPACLVIYHQYCRRFSLAPLSTYSLVESSPKLFQFAQKIEGLKSKWDQIWRKFFKTLFPRFILKARYIFIVLFGALSIGAILVVFYYPGLKLPDKEQFQLFTASHPFETWVSIIFVYCLYFFFSIQCPSIKNIADRDLKWRPLDCMP